MKICVAQTLPTKGDVERNIESHKKLIDLAVAHGANIIIFPELSLTGYEPALAKTLAIHPDDRQLDEFQEISDSQQIIIGVGMPLKNQSDVSIGMVIFRPHQARHTYLKQYLHPDEYPYFVEGHNPSVLIDSENNIALAICYEISVAEHEERTSQASAKIYVASVVKFVKGMEKALVRLSELARNNAMTVLMSNCVGFCDGEECGGKSSIWDAQGNLIGQLDDTHEGILMIDTQTQELFQTTIQRP